MRLTRTRIEELLETWPVARLATVGPEGPHLVPIVFARAAGALWCPVDGKPKRGGELARIHHVRSDPRVALLLDEYTSDWSELWWLRVDGEAAVVRPALEDDPEVAAALAALRAKYPAYASGEVSLLADPPTLLRIRIGRLRSWSAGMHRPQS